MKWLHLSLVIGALALVEFGTTQDPAKQAPIGAPIEAPREAPKEAPKPAPTAYGDKPPAGAYVQSLHPQNPFDIKGDDIDKGGDVTKACRYDEPPWSDCDAFELIRYRTLRLVSGGRQCEEAKNMTKKCTPYELPAGR